jgi:serine/threonine-protein kinase
MKRAIALFVAAIAGQVAFAGAALAQNYRDYGNPRFGVHADVPANWRADRPPENGDGQRFISPDGRASITVSGMYHVDDTIKEAIESRARPDGVSVTYVKREARSVVASGLKGDRIVYTKSMLSCGDSIWNSVWIEYPASEKQKYDALVSRVAGSLRGARGGECSSR